MLALFEAAARFTDDLPPGSPRLFLDSLAGQEIAGDTLAEQAVREDCVRVLTAHRSKGLEWDVVVVAGVQEEVWPDLRLRGSLLGADELAEAARPDASAWTAAWPLARAASASRPPTSPPPRSPPGCSPRSAACSTSPSRGRGGCSW